MFIHDSAKAFSSPPFENSLRRNNEIAGISGVSRIWLIRYFLKSSERCGCGRVGGTQAGRVMVLNGQCQARARSDEGLCHPFFEVVGNLGLGDADIKVAPVVPALVKATFRKNKIPRYNLLISPTCQ